MKKIKVLHLITSLNIGGTEKYLLSIAKIQKTRYNLSVGFLKKRGKIADELEKAGVPVYYLGSPWRLWRFLRKEEIQLLHTHLYRANILGRVVGGLAGVPIILSSQQSIDSWKRIYHTWLDGLSSRFAHSIIANSHAAEKILVVREKIPAKKIKVIYTTIDTATFSYNRDRPAIGKNGSTVTIGCVARLHPEKGVQYIPLIGQQLKEKIPRLKMLVIGDGPWRAKLEKTIGHLGLSENIVLLGWRNDIKDLLSAMDVFFLPSREESFPRGILEALAMARPVVATDVGGVGEIIRDKLHGLLVPPQNPAALAEAILWILENKGEARAMAERGRDRVREYFSLDRMMKETEELYSSLIRERMAPR
jgi:glycosyltransferase involved in cell wall biosynthesis